MTALYTLLISGKRRIIMLTASSTCRPIKFVPTKPKRKIMASARKIFTNGVIGSSHQKRSSSSDPYRAFMTGAPAPLSKSNRKETSKYVATSGIRMRSPVSNVLRKKRDFVLFRFKTNPPETFVVQRYSSLQMVKQQPRV